METPRWNADRYLSFAKERSQPALDLVARLPLAEANRIVDLGCGPGNSTAALAERYAKARLIGLDSSPDMLERARGEPGLSGRAIEWQLGSIQAWSPPEQFDIVFSNAALHWVPNHNALIPDLFSRVAEGGALAFQVPDNFDSVEHALMRDIVAEEPWASQLGPLAESGAVEPPETYYNLLTPLARTVDIWRTDYFHVMRDHRAIIEWMRGAALRPILAALPETLQEAFLERYLASLAEAFAPQADGRVLLRFRRIFVIATR
jgi:trans-aconitate 2-methyltransferase